MSQGNRTVVVTGGTGALGQAVVRAFRASDDRVVVPWIVKDERDALAGLESQAVEAGQLVLLEADVADSAGAASVAKAAGAIDVLVNGVGGFAGGSPVHETDLELWDRMYRVNLRTAVAMTRAALPDMLERGSGVILNITSQAAATRPAGLAAYSAAKDAVIVLTEALHKEVSAAGIRVNAVAPATIDTPANRAAMPEENFASWTPPERIAAVLLWLASESAATVRGGTLPV
jgi:NAD(P)-dependent dehydrogenase (short-subunit alcohol dehydrogenase family)